MKVTTVALLAIAGMGIYYLRRMFRSSVIMCKCLIGQPKLVVLTGATSGIGLAAAHELCARRHNLILPCRNLDQGYLVKMELEKLYPNSFVDVHFMDLNKPDSIQKFVNKLSNNSIDALVNNAGLMSSKLKFKVLGDHCIDEPMAVNFLGTSYFTRQMMPKLRTPSETSKKPCIVFVSSSLANKAQLPHQSPLLLRDNQKWVAMQSYAKSKLALNIYAQHLHETQGDRVNVYTMVTGGMVDTNLNRDFLTNFSWATTKLIKLLSGLLFLSPEQGCQTLVHCVSSEDVASAHCPAEWQFRDCSGSGLLYRNCQPVEWPITMDNVGVNKAVLNQMEKIFMEMEEAS